jgi:hypothetical protein
MLVSISPFGAVAAICAQRSLQAGIVKSVGCISQAERVGVLQNAHGLACGRSPSGSIRSIAWRHASQSGTAVAVAFYVADEGSPARVRSVGHADSFCCTT